MNLHFDFQSEFQHTFSVHNSFYLLILVRNDHYIVYLNGISKDFSVVVSFSLIIRKRHSECEQIQLFHQKRSFELCKSHRNMFEI